MRTIVIEVVQREHQTSVTVRAHFHDRTRMVSISSRAVRVPAPETDCLDEAAAYELAQAVEAEIRGWQPKLPLGF